MSCSVASWRVSADGVICGLGGCKIASGHRVLRLGDGPAEGAPGRVLAGDQPLALVHGGREGVLLYLQVADRGRLAVPLVGHQVRVLAVGVAGRGWLCWAERLDLPVRVAAAEFGVG